MPREKGFSIELFDVIVFCHIAHQSKNFGSWYLENVENREIESQN